MWVQNSRRDDLCKKTPASLYASFRVCAEHFEPSQFMNQQQRYVNNVIMSIDPQLCFCQIFPQEQFDSPCCANFGERTKPTQVVGQYSATSKVERTPSTHKEEKGGCG